MLPIPIHLHDIFIPIGNKNNEYQINGEIRCTCGCKCFHIKIFADTSNGYPQVRSYEDDYALVIKTICMDCQKEYIIFDDSKHGWNGFVCHDGISPPENTLTSWNCPQCGSDIHRIRIFISSEGKEDFINELELGDETSEFSEDDWVNAFGWITIGLTCYTCSYADEKWIDYETM